MITGEQISYKNIGNIIAGVALLLAIPSIWPYGYFIFLRWVVLITGSYSAYLSYKLDKKPWVITFIIVVILFNPTAPVYLDKEMWIIVDIITAIIFFSSIKLIRNKNENN